MFGTQSSRTYIKIGADGTIRQKVTADTEGAVRRDYELPDGTKGTAWELVYSWVEGYIANAYFTEGKYGTQLMLDIQGTDGNEATLSIGLNSRFAEPIMQALPNVDPEQIVKIQPYDYEKDGKRRTGVSIYQDGERIASYFQKWDDKAKKFEYLNGYPEPKDISGKDEWKLYFTQTRIWLRKFLESNTLAKFDKAPAAVASEPEDEPLDLNSIPF